MYRVGPAWRRLRSGIGGGGTRKAVRRSCCSSGVLWASQPPRERRRRRTLRRTPRVLPSASRFLHSQGGSSTREPPKAAADATVAASTTTTATATATASTTLLDRILFRPAITMGEEDAQATNRWARVLPFFMIQGVTGSVYAWSCFNTPLCTQLGVLGSASTDWGLGDVLPIFSVSATVLSLVTASLGSTMDRLGPRFGATCSAAAWMTGLSISALACQMHSLPLLYAGYGLTCGSGWGFGYVAPISGLLAWFPDKRGLVQGVGMTVFGLGSLTAPIYASNLIDKFYKPPQAVDPSVPVFTENGVRYAEVAGEVREVIVATTTDAAHGIYEGTAYLVGTGDSGLAMTFMALGCTYSSLLLTAALFARVPPPGFKPNVHHEPPPETIPAPKHDENTIEGKMKVIASEMQDALQLLSNRPRVQDRIKTILSEWQEAAQLVASGKPAAQEKAATDANPKAESEPVAVKKVYTAEEVQVTASEALKTYQFWYLLGVMCGNSTAGLGIMAAGKVLMTDCFAVSNPEIATPAFCAMFVSALAGANTVGRFVWGMVADKVGRRKCLLLFATAAPACLIVPSLIIAATGGSGGTMPLIGFVLATFGIASCFGGVFAVLPAYVADLFGASNAGAIMGRILCGFSAAAIIGPGMLTYLRTKGDREAVEYLAEKVDPAIFESTFGAPVSQVAELWEKKTVTIQNLMTLIPPELGVQDPTHMLYTTTFYAMGGILACTALLSWRTGPVRKDILRQIMKERAEKTAKTK